MPIPEYKPSSWFEKEIKIHEPSLRAYVCGKIPKSADADDIIQETYVRILKLKNKEEIASPKSLLFTIARNIINDLFRKKYVSKTISLGEMELLSVLSHQAGNTNEYTIGLDEIKILQDAIKSLPPKCRKIVLLRNYENLSYKEIAARLNLSVKTVENQLIIGIKKCRKYLERQGVRKEG